ncbi:DUF6531 domain-containing protein [Spirillospora sp. NPDC127200]
MTRRRGGGGRPGGNRNGGGRRGGRGNGGPISGPIGRAAGQSFRTPKGRSGGGGGGPRGGGRNPNGRRNGNTPSQRRRGNDQSNAKPNDTKSTTKDPIDVVTGEVLLSQTDVDLPGVLPLLLERTHISTYGAGHLFGRTWASTLDQHLELDSEGVYYLTEDARVLKFPQALLPNVQFRPVAGPQWPLVLTSDGGYTLTDPQLGRTLHFPAPGEEHGWTRLPLTAISDRNGNRIDFLYEDQVLVEVRHSGGYRIAVDSAPLDAERSRTERRVTALRLLAADAQADDITLIRFGYDAEGNLAEVVNSSGRPLRFTYDDEGRLTGWIDRNDFWYRYEYDEEGRAVRGVGKDGYLSATLAYDPDNRVTRVTDSLGHTTTYRYNELYQVVAETDPLGNTTHSEWDRHDRLLARTDPLGHTTRYTYDDQGNVLSVVHPDGVRTTAVFNDLNQAVQITGPGGATWRREFDGRGNLTAVTDPSEAVTRFGHDAAGRPISITDPLGHTTLLESNAAGLTTASSDPLGHRTGYSYDAAGRIVSVTDPTGAATRFGWTVEGSPAWRTLPGGGTERWGYDAEGNLISYLDQVGRTTRFEQGAFDLLTAQVQPDGTRLEYGYDTELRLISVRDPQGMEWSYEYDAAGRLTSERDFNGRTIAYAYDEAGRLISRTNGAGETLTFAYDAAGNVTRKQHGDQVTLFEYDRAGRLVRATAPGSDLRFEYDPAGRLVTETCNGRSVVSEFDAAGNRLRRRTPSGADSVWTYGPSGLPLSLATAGQVIGFVHDAAGQEAQRRIGSGAIVAQQWDPAGRLASQTIWGAPKPADSRPALLQHRAYAYRPDDHLTALGDRLTGDRRVLLDGSDRVTAVQAHGWSEQYAYDATGNLIRGVWPLPPQGAEEDSLGDREFTGTLIRRAGRVRYEHDGQGRVVLRQHPRPSSKPATWRYHWDADDRMVGVETPEGHHWRYLYDALGRRIAKRRIAPDGQGVLEQVDFVWDGPRLAEQVRRTWSPQHRSHLREGSVWNYEPDGFRPLTQTDRAFSEQSQEWFDQRFHAIVTDVSGAPAELVAPNGELADVPRSSLWGAAPPGLCPLRFPGQYYDPETGLHYNYERYYDPRTGAYQSPDPLGLAPQPNPHAYVANPLAEADPLGLAPYAANQRWANRMTFDQQQVKKKYKKHAQPFNLPPNYNPKNAKLFEQAMRDHVRDPNVKSYRVNYRGQGPGIAFVNPQTNNMVLLKPNGEFWSAWKLGHKWHKGNVPQDLDVYRNGGLW